MQFNLVGQGDNFLHVALTRGESISSESNAMVMMEGNLDLIGEMRGGFWSAVSRKFTNGESFFTQSIKAVRGDGETLLSPVLPGDIHVLNCSPTQQYFLNDGAFLACSSEVTVKAKTQGIGRALFGGTGGFFVGYASGNGPLAVSGFGSVFELNVDTSPENPVTIDNNHVVAWDARLQYDVALSTNRSSGLLGSIVNSAMSGEGIVTKFSGKGTVLICSRNRSDFVSWMAWQMKPAG